jgi:UDP-glucose:(heptosyl)LPS alpha-1,3-glucosyltransferase
MEKDIAFCLFEYFTHGGLQRDCLRIAQRCQRAGAGVRVYTMGWHGPIPDGFDVRIVPTRGLTNHGRASNFADQVRSLLLEQPAQLVVGFNKMPGLDVYFASDVCFAQTIMSRHPLYRLTPRCRTYLAMERAVFDAEAKTHILLISPRQVEDYRKHYGLREGRYTLMPPGLDGGFEPPENADSIRSAIRTELGLDDDSFLLLHVGSAFRRKGVDRVIIAIAALPDRLRQRCLFLVAGKGRESRYRIRAKMLGVGKNVRFAGVRHDVPELMASADMLLHPAREENTGLTLLEALASSLPVICSGACGYASYVAHSSGGTVLDEPFSPQDLNNTLRQMLDRHILQQRRQAIRTYLNKNDLSGLVDKACEYILGRLA